MWEGGEKRMLRGAQAVLGGIAGGEDAVGKLVKVAFATHHRIYTISDYHPR